MSFLQENHKIHLISSLKENQLADLEQFLKWLTNYNKANKAHFRDLFKSAKQNDQCFMSYFLRLCNLYRKSKNKTSNDAFTEADKEQIARQFIKNLKNEEIKRALLNQPDIIDQFDDPEKGLVAKSNDFLQRYQECLPTTNSTNIISSEFMSQINNRFESLTLLMAKQNETKYSKRDLRCSKCGKKGSLNDFSN